MLRFAFYILFRREKEIRENLTDNFNFRIAESFQNATNLQRETFQDQRFENSCSYTVCCK